MFFRVCVIFALLFIQFQLSYHLSLVDSSWVELPEENRQIWHPLLYKTLSFGHLPVMVDWIFLRCLQQTTVTSVAKGSHSVLYYNLDLLTELDPLFYDVYISGANFLSVMQRDGEGAKNLLLKASQVQKSGLSEYPIEFIENNWSMPWKTYISLAYNYLFELNDLPKASISFQEAAKYKGAPEYLLRLDQKLRKPGGEYLVGIRLLGFMLTTAKDQTIINELQEKKEALEINYYFYELNNSFKSFLGNFKGGKNLEKSWIRFKSEKRMGETDPWGGMISLNSNGEIVSTTPRKPILGLN